MGEKPKENSGMSKDMANEAITLPDLYYRVAKVCQGVRVLNLYPPTWEGGAWSIDSAGGTSSSISTSMAESLILAACVRWLVDKHCIPMFQKDEKRGLYECSVFYEEDIEHRSWHQSLTIAALLAVEAVCEERSHV